MLLPRIASRTREEVHNLLEIGKRNQPSVKAANDDDLASRRIFVTDRNSRLSYLIDTGTDICVFPRSKLHGPVNRSEYELFAANGTRITTYGTVAISLNLSPRRAFTWNFTVGNAKTPIISMDFLNHYGLLVQQKAHRHDNPKVIEGIHRHDRRSVC